MSETISIDENCDETITITDTTNITVTPTPTITSPITTITNTDDKYDKLLKLMEIMQSTQQRNYDILSNNLMLALDKIKLLETSKLKYKSNIEFACVTNGNYKVEIGGPFSFECEQKFKTSPFIWITREDTTIPQTVSVTYTLHSHLASYKNHVKTIHHTFKINESKGAEYEIDLKLIKKNGWVFGSMYRLLVKIETLSQPQKMKLRDSVIFKQ